MEANDRDEFNKLAEGRRRGLVSEFWTFLVHKKKWWLTPIILVLAIVGLLAVLGGTAVAPFVYTLF